MDVAAYKAFLKKRAKDFQSIANQTEGEMEVDDLHSEAWFAAEYHAAKRGFEIDWSDPADQKLIFGTLTVKHVWRKRAERELTVSADEVREDSDEISTLITVIRDEEVADPLEMLERREEEQENKAKNNAIQEKEDAILESYSQSVAYNIAIWHFDNIRCRLSNYLAIDRGTLRDRIDAAAKVLKVQPSLFDRIERITSSFWPLQGLGYCRKTPQHLSGDQWSWDF